MPLPGAAVWQLELRGGRLGVLPAAQGVSAHAPGAAVDTQPPPLPLPLTFS
jgi:hypothetical protein